MGVVCPRTRVLVLVGHVNLFSRLRLGSVSVLVCTLPWRRSSEAILSRKSKDSPRDLTAREKEVAGILTRTGLSYKQAASELHICEGTMRKHTENVYRKKGVHSRAELTVVLLGESK